MTTIGNSHRAASLNSKGEMGVTQPHSTTSDLNTCRTIELAIELTLWTRGRGAVGALGRMIAGMLLQVAGYRIDPDDHHLIARKGDRTWRIAVATARQGAALRFGFTGLDTANCDLVVLVGLMIDGELVTFIAPAWQIAVSTGAQIADPEKYRGFLAPFRQQPYQLALLQ